MAISWMVEHGLIILCFEDYESNLQSYNGVQY